MNSTRSGRWTAGGAGGFTLIELLTVAFIISVLVAMMLPAIQSYRRKSLEQRTHSWIRSIKQALDSYRTDFGDYPPSEPDRVLWTDPQVRPFATADSNRLYGIYGSAALVFYLQGRNEDGYNGYDDTGDSPHWSLRSQQLRTWPPRVQNVPVRNRSWTPPNGYSLAYDGFMDTWGNVIEYFRAYRGRGETADRIFPRAVNMTGSGGDYRFVFPGSSQYANGHVVGGYNIRVPAIQWLDEAYSDYRTGWPSRAVPVNAGSVLLVSPGPDGLFGSDDDVGNW